MLRVINRRFMLRVILLNVIMLSVAHRHTVFMTQTLADVEFKIWLLESMSQHLLFYSLTDIIKMI